MKGLIPIEEMKQKRLCSFSTFFGNAQMKQVQRLNIENRILVFWPVIWRKIHTTYCILYPVQEEVFKFGHCYLLSLLRLSTFLHSLKQRRSLFYFPETVTGSVHSLSSPFISNHYVQYLHASRGISHRLTSFLHDSFQTCQFHYKISQQ